MQSRRSRAASFALQHCDFLISSKSCHGRQTHQICLCFVFYILAGVCRTPFGRMPFSIYTGCFFWDESRFLSGTVKYAKCMLNHKKDLLGNKYAVRHSFRKIQNWKVYFGGSILHVKILLGYYRKFLKRIIFWVTTTFLSPAATIWRPVAIPLHHKKCVATLLNIKNLFMMLL